MNVTTEPAAIIDTDFTITIGGKSVSTADSAPVYNPATRSVTARVPVPSRYDLDRAVAAARDAFPAWAALAYCERQAAVAAIGDRLEAHAETFMKLLTAEQGKPRAMAEWEISGSIMWFREVAKQSLPEEVIQDS